MSLRLILSAGGHVRCLCTLLARALHCQGVCLRPRVVSAVRCMRDASAPGRVTASASVGGEYTLRFVRNQ